MRKFVLTFAPMQAQKREAYTMAENSWEEKWEDWKIWRLGSLALEMIKYGNFLEVGCKREDFLEEYENTAIRLHSAKISYGKTVGRGS